MTLSSYREKIREEPPAKRGGGAAILSHLSGKEEQIKKDPEPISHSTLKEKTAAQVPDKNKSPRANLRKYTYAPDPRFEKFWALYPNKTLKGHAEKAWNKLKPTDELFMAILAKVAEASLTDKWTKDGGTFIPNPAKWLHGRGWLDDFMPIKKVRQLVE